MLRGFACLCLSFSCPSPVSHPMFAVPSALQMYTVPSVLVILYQLYCPPLQE